MKINDKFPILIVTENLQIGGAEKYTIMLANELHRLGHKVVVLANMGPFRNLLDPNIRFVRAFFEHGFWGMLYGAFLIALVTWQENIRFVHTQKLECSQSAWLAKFVTGRPVIKTVHGYTPKELTYLGRKINKYSDRLIVVVDWLAKELVKNGVDKNKITVVHNGMEPFGKHSSAKSKQRLKKELGINPKDRVVVSISRLEKGKNYAALIEWFPWVLSEVPHAKLIIVGSGPEKRNLVRETKELGLYHAVIFVDGTTNIRPYLEIADVFCTPSIGRGMAVMEAMAAGLPVVGIRPVGEPRVIISGQTGFLISQKQGHLYAHRIADLLRQPAKAKLMGRNARQRIAKQFKLQTMVDGIEEVYRKLN